jgi:hypothetical protein
VDYIVGFVLLAVPDFLRLYFSEPVEWVPRTFGTFLLFINLATQHEVGLMKMMPMRVHLVFDYMLGALLAASPWLFGFSHIVWVPHLGIGLFIMLWALVSKRNPRTAYAEPT